MTARRLAPLVLSIPLVGTAALAGPVKTPPPAASVVASVQVNVVNVDVLVTDREGQPVTGLTAADFNLYEDGKPMAITNFYVSEPGPRAPAVENAASIETSQPEAPFDEEKALHLVVVVDGLNLDMAGAQLALEALAKVVETSLRPGDDVMVTSFDRALKIDEPFTTDFRTAATKIRALKRIGAQAAMRRVAGSMIRGRMGSGSGMSADMNEVAAGNLLNDIVSAAEEERSLQWCLLDSTGRLVDSLAGLPGRKVLVLVSNGMPDEVGSNLLNEYNARYPGHVSPIDTRTRFGMTSFYSILAARANAGRVTFYPICAQAFPGLESYDASEPDLQGDPGGASFGAAKLQLSLLRIASATGGKVLANSGLLTSKLVETVDNVDAAYSLGYSPSHVGDGQYHRFKVEVKRDGVKLRHREGYLDKPPEERAADRTAAALLRVGRTNRFGLQAAAAPAVHTRSKVFTVPLTVTLPGSTVTLLPTRKGLEGKVSVLIAARDPQGRSAEVFRKSFPIPVPEADVERLKAQNLVFTFDVLVRQGTSTLAVTARDEAGGGESTVTLVVEALRRM